MALIKCRECGNNIAKNAKCCPHCGAPNKKPIHRRWWFALLIVVLFIGLFTPVKPDYSKKLEVLSAEIVGTTDGKHRVVTGKIQNNNDVDLDLVLLSITLYDRNGNIVGDCASHIGFLGAGDIWDFTTTTLEEDAVSFEITTLNGQKNKETGSGFCPLS